MYFEHKHEADDVETRKRIYVKISAFTRLMSDFEDVLFSVLSIIKFIDIKYVQIIYFFIYENVKVFTLFYYIRQSFK